VTGDLKSDLQNALRSAGLAFSADAVAQSEIELRGSDLVIRAPRAMLLALRDASVQRLASTVAGKPVRVKAEVGENMTVAAAAPASSSTGDGDSGLRERALSDPGVKRFQELFPGAQVRTVRNLNE
jgi:IS4 transposase